MIDLITSKEDYGKFFLNWNIGNNKIVLVSGVQQTDSVYICVCVYK